MSGFGQSGFGQSGFGQTTPQTGGFGGFGQQNQTQNQPSAAFGAPAASPFGQTNTNAGGGLFGGGNTNTTSAFGGGGGFGATNNDPKPSGFGQTGATMFGQPATQSQPSAFGGGGGFGANTNAQTTGFGAFGQPAQQQQTSGFGTSGGFGQTQQQPSAFGQPANAPATGAFGAPAATGFGQQSSVNPNNGTGATPYSAHTERDGATASYFQNVVCMQPYTGYSQEELRSVDYNQGRRFGNSNGQGGAFGQSTGFGGGFGATNNTATSGFGASTGGGLFGQQQNQTSGFGQTSTTSPFGAASSGGLFGQKPATTGFGSTPATSAPTTGFGATTGGTTGFGQTTGSAFGASNNNASPFGQQNQHNQPKPLFGASTGSGFGSTGGFGQSTNTGGGLFGSQNNQQQQSSPFGQTQTNQPTSSPFSGGFGQTQNQNQNQQQGASPFGGFGGQTQNNEQKPNPFGSTTNTTGGLFGQTQQQQPQQQQQGSGLFGGAQQNNTGGLFGQQNNQAKPAGGLFGGATSTTSSGNPFGGFGQNNQIQQTQSSGLFGQSNTQPKPLFGAPTNNNTGTSNLFGGFGQSTNQQQQQQQPQQSNSLFGQPQQQQPQMGNSLFGNSQQSQQSTSQQPSYLTTSINSETPYGNDQLFMSLGTPQQSVGPLVTPLSSSQKPRQRAPLPTYRLNPSASARLITPQKRPGYGFDYSTYGTPGSAFNSPSPMYGRSLLGSGGMGRSLSKSHSLTNMRAGYSPEDSILSPGAFSASGLRTSGSASLKKLKINRSLRTDLFGTESSNDPSYRASPLKKRVSFDADASDKEPQQNGTTSNALVRVEESESPNPSAEEQGYLRSSRSKPSSSSGAPAQQEMQQVKGNELAVVPEDKTPSPPQVAPKPATSAADAAKASQKDMVPGAYFMIPSRAEVDKMSRKDRANISPFTVGRENAGKIEFEKVDLSNVDLNRIGGDIVRIEVRSATVYADHANKPEPGKEMNFPATVTLDNSWPRSKGGKLPIFERKGPRFDKHIERLRRVGGTEFVKYDVENGQWVFRVQHFSTYTFDYSDDESMLSPAPSSRVGGRSGLMPRASQGAPQPREDDGYSSHGSSYRSSDMDDTFEFRTSKTLPGAFEGDVISEDEMDQPYKQEAPQRAYRSRRAESHDSSVFDDAPEDYPMSTDGANDAPAAPTRSGSGHLVSPLKGTPMKPGRSILKTAQPTVGTPWKVQLSEDLDWAAQLQRTLSPKKQDRQTLRQSQGQFLRESRNAAPKDAIGGLSKETHPFATSIDVMNSLFGKPQATVGRPSSKQSDEGKGFQWPYSKRSKPSETDQSDVDKAFHQSFKPSWAADGTLSHAQPSNRDVGCDRPQAPASQQATASLQHFRRSARVQIERGVPAASYDETLSFENLASNVTDAGNVSGHERLMWQLTNTLFSETNTQDASGNNDTPTRRERLSELWKTIAAPAAEAHIIKAQKERKVSYEELALLQLSGNDVWAATETLSTGRDFRLSAMIAQLGAEDDGGEAIRKSMSDQIEEWRQSNMLSEMSPAIRALYELLAGKTCNSTGKTGAGPENRAETFNLTSRFQFDWRRSFALRLWYGIDGADQDGLAKAIESYAKDVAAYREETRPVPWFVEQNVDVGYNDQQRQDRQDILFGLMKIFGHQQDPDGWFKGRVKLADIIAPQNLSGNPMDSRLSFQLYQALTAHDIVYFSDDEDECNHKSDVLTTDYAYQLSGSADNLVDAVFVTMHLHDSVARENGIKALLNRYAAAIGEDTSTCPIFKAVQNDLKVPAAWIWKAKALHAKSALRDDVKESRYLLAGGDKTGAHAVFTDSMAPRCIIEEERRTISDLIDLFKENGMEDLQQWDEGAGMYGNFLKIVHTAEKGGDAAEALQLAKDIAPMLIEMQKNKELRVRVAGCEMADDVEKAVEVFRRRLGKAGKQANDETILPKMPMASDEVLRKAKEMSSQYYAGLGL